MSPTPTPANIFPLRARDHEDSARAAISWFAERHRKGWGKAFENLLDDWHPEVSEGGLQLDEDGMTIASINAGEWFIARGEIHAFFRGRSAPLPSCARRWCLRRCARRLPVPRP